MPTHFLRMVHPSPDSLGICFKMVMDCSAWTPCEPSEAISSARLASAAGSEMTHLLGRDVGKAWDITTSVFGLGKVGDGGSVELETYVAKGRHSKASAIS